MVDQIGYGREITDKKVCIGVIDHHSLQVERPEENLAAHVHADAVRDEVGVPVSVDVAAGGQPVGAQRGVERMVDAPRPGGQWAENSVSASWEIGTLSYAEMLSLPGYAYAEHYADALEDYAAPEPLPWSTLFTTRGRLLARHGRGERGEDLYTALTRVLETCRRAGLNCYTARIEAALGGKS